MENKKQNQNKAAARSYMQTILEGGIVFKDMTNGCKPRPTGDLAITSCLDGSRIQISEDERSK